MSTTITVAGESFSPHLLMIPLPAQGHLLPLLDLAQQLSAMAAASGLPLTITAVVTPKNLPLLSPFLSSSPSIQPLVLPLPTSLPSSAEHVRDLPPNHASHASLIHALSLLSPHILSWAHSLLAPPTALLSDFLLGWSLRLARDLRIPRINFSSSAAILISVLHALFGKFDDSAAHTYDLPPPLPSIPYDHLPSVFRRCRAHAGVTEWDFVADSMASNAGSYATVVNSFDALESGYLDYLMRSYGHDRVWAVGPIAARGVTAPCLPEDVAAWLDPLPKGSVLYVCFGSQFRIRERHARVLAAALESSGVRFMWAGQAELPEGFEERTRGRGLVITGWAPQRALLGHDSIGAFVTHCGWNSVLEGIVAGVLLLAWPMEADQFINAKLLVEEREVALRACEGGPDAVPEAGELARLLAEAVDGGKHVRVKARAEEMRRAALDAVGEGGSSHGDLLEFFTMITTKE